MDSVLSLASEIFTAANPRNFEISPQRKQLGIEGRKLYVRGVGQVCHANWNCNRGCFNHRSEPRDPQIFDYREFRGFSKEANQFRPTIKGKNFQRRFYNPSSNRYISNHFLNQRKKTFLVLPSPPPPIARFK